MQTYKLSFDGNVLNRGFWVYVWQITHHRDRYYYVGRTGDSSSIHAASPFSRISQHLDMRNNAKGNTLFRRLSERNIAPQQCTFELACFGPIYLEVQTTEDHRVRRDRVGQLEAALAQHLRDQNLTVLGKHDPLKQSWKEDEKWDGLNDLFHTIRQKIETALEITSPR